MVSRSNHFVYAGVTPPPISFFSPTKVAGMKSFLESDNADVWQIYSDGMADVRINKDF